MTRKKKRHGCLTSARKRVRNDKKKERIAREQLAMTVERDSSLQKPLVRMMSGMQDCPRMWLSEIAFLSVRFLEFPAHYLIR